MNVNMVVMGIKAIKSSCSRVHSLLFVASEYIANQNSSAMLPGSRATSGNISSVISCSLSVRTSASVRSLLPRITIVGNTPSIWSICSMLARIKSRRTSVLLAPAFRAHITLLAVCVRPHTHNHFQLTSYQHFIITNNL